MTTVFIPSPEQLAEYEKIKPGFASEALVLQKMAIESLKRTDAAKKNEYRLLDYVNAALSFAVGLLAAVIAASLWH